MDGVPEVVCSGGSLPKRVRTNNMLDQKRLSSFLPKPNEQTYHCFAKVSETPPPSYEEALYRNSVRLPGLQVSSIFSFLQSFLPLHTFQLMNISGFLFFVISRLLCLALSSVFTFISPPGAFDCPPLLITTHLILYLILFCISDGDPNQSCGCHSGRHIFALSASHFWTPH